MPTPTKVPISCDWEELDDSGSGTVNFTAPTWTKQYATVQANESDAVARAENYFLINPTINVNGVLLLLHEYKVNKKGVVGSIAFIFIIEATFRYAVDYFEMSGDTTGATFKALQAIDEGDYYNLLASAYSTQPLTPAAQEMPDFGGLIGVNGQAVEGVDVPIPKDDFTILIRTKFSTMPPDWIATVKNLGCRANSRPLHLVFNGQQFDWEEEELLFYGLTWKMTSQDDFEGNLKFGTSRSEILTLGLRDDINKIGWRYVWQYAEYRTIAGRRTPVPSAAVVNQVLKTADLYYIGIFS